MTSAKALVTSEAEGQTRWVFEFQMEDAQEGLNDADEMPRFQEPAMAKEYDIMEALAQIPLWDCNGIVKLQMDANTSAELDTTAMQESKTRWREEVERAERKFGQAP